MGRAPPCSSSSRSDQNGLKKGPWTPEEDQKLIDYIQKHGYGNWRSLPKNAGLERCGKSCRLRWTNYLRPDIKRGRFSFEEEEAIIQLHSILGNKWSTIAASLPGRTDNEIKNYWNTRIRKRLLMMGIDPVTHRPRLNLVHDHLSSIVHSYLYNNPSSSSSSSSPPPADQIVMNNNMSRFLGLQNNSHQPCGTLLKPATSVPLSSSHHHHQQNSPSNFHMPQHNEEIHPHHAQLINDNNHHAPVQTQPQFSALPPLIQTSSPKLEAEPPFPTSTLSPSFPYPSSDQPQPLHHSSLATYPLMNISDDFDAQFLCDLVPNCTATQGSEDGRDWQRHDTALPSHEFQSHNPARYDQRDRTNILDIWSHNDATLDQSSRRDFFTLPPTVFSTPSSSPTPLNSTTTTTTTTTTDDERESYCSSILRFDSPLIFEDFII